MRETDRLKVYFDGSCRVCSREMTYYRRRDEGGLLEFIDISGSDFDAETHGRSREEFMARLHVRLPGGEMATGIDAFAAIWRSLPGTHLDLLAAMVQLPGLHLAATLGYELFAGLRPWLPKQAGSCNDESCRWGHPHPRQ